MAFSDIPIPFMMPIYFLRVTALIKITINIVIEATTIPIRPITLPKRLNARRIWFKNSGIASFAVWILPSFSKPARIKLFFTSVSLNVVSGSSRIAISFAFTSGRSTKRQKSSSVKNARSETSPTFESTIPFTINVLVFSPTLILT